MATRNRIQGLEFVRAGDLRPNPKNWRRHSTDQADAMRGVLESIGYAGAVIARRCDDGALELIDGHLRAELDADETLPVLVLDVTAAEADLLLATYDPLSAMADTDEGLLATLLEQVDTDNEAVAQLLADLMPEEPPDVAPAGPGDQSNLDDDKCHECPNCGHRFED